MINWVIDFGYLHCRSALSVISVLGVNHHCAILSGRVKHLPSLDKSWIYRPFCSGHQEDWTICFRTELIVYDVSLLHKKTICLKKKWRQLHARLFYELYILKAYHVPLGFIVGIKIVQRLLESVPLWCTSIPCFWGNARGMLH